MSTPASARDDCGEQSHSQRIQHIVMLSPLHGIAIQDLCISSLHRQKLSIERSLKLKVTSPKTQSRKTGFTS